MPKFAIHNSDGDILRMISCPVEHIARQVQDGEQYLECEAHDWDRIDMETMQVIPMPEPGVIVDESPAYVQQRRALYPSVESQLDLLYHAMDRGEIPKAEAFFNTLKTIKEAVPKDGTTGPTIIYELGELPDEGKE
ncbi:hypothetical protein [Acidovorax sp.]|uniref:hypothetical protein n=1 Tax=Acidovorax sp. TaxID=1872122 RepID=UPI00391F454B